MSERQKNGEILVESRDFSYSICVNRIRFEFGYNLLRAKTSRWGYQKVIKFEEMIIRFDTFDVEVEI